MAKFSVKSLLAPKQPLGSEIECALGLALAGAAAMIALTCGARGQLTPKADAQNAPGKTRGAASARAATPSPASSANLASSGAAENTGAPARDPSELALPHFFADLSALEQRARKAPVRVVWFGDSHTAADYLTGALRARLQTRFGAGGPGFVRIGVKPYRHTQMHWACDGPWRIEPPQPSRRAQFDDGIFGLGGMRAFPGDAPAFASFEVSKGTAHGALSWQLWYSLPDNATFRMDLAGVSQVVTKASAADTISGAGFSRLTLTSALADKLQITTLGGEPHFYGLIAEGSEPGLVLDAVGIDGARIATLLAWNEASFEAALQTRAPSLVAFAFGTNEAFDAEKVEKYRAEYRDTLARARKAAPSSDCLIVGPPDANAVSGGSEPRVTEIDALQRSVAGEQGCGFVSQLEIMGGPGSYTHWANKLPPLARGDRLHLTPKGYEAVAAAIADKLLAAYGKTSAKAH
ncbi:MAG TPA: GDSL-type esterase/lipase family protein [Polyangiaceae bacterium]|jgi:lysophospholipase L1-like esterase